MRSLTLLIFVIFNVQASFSKDEDIKTKFQLLSLQKQRAFHISLIKHLAKRDMSTKYNFKTNNLKFDQRTSHFLFENISNLFFRCAYANEETKLCNFGGWMSLMTEGEQCTPPWSSTVRRNETVQLYGDVYDSGFSCGGADLFRCNPLLFGPGPENGDGKGFCARAKDDDPRDSTYSCMRNYLADNDYVDQHLLALSKDPEKLSQYLNVVVKTVRFCENSNYGEYPYCPEMKEIMTDHASMTIQCADRDKLIETLPQVVLPLNLEELDRLSAGLGTEAQAYIERLRQERIEALAHNQAVYEAAYSAYLEDNRTLATMDRLRANSDRCIADSCRGSKSSTTSVGYCARYMKYAFFPTNDATSYGKWADYPWGSDAVESGEWLESHGFVNLMDDPSLEGITPENAPLGAIIVYEDMNPDQYYTVDGQRRGGPGHIEMKLSENEFASDFINDEPTRIGGARKPIGIYINIPDEFKGRLRTIPEVAGE